MANASKAFTALASAANPIPNTYAFPGGIPGDPGALLGVADGMLTTSVASHNDLLRQLGVSSAASGTIQIPPHLFNSGNLFADKLLHAAKMLSDKDSNTARVRR